MGKSAGEAIRDGAKDAAKDAAHGAWNVTKNAAKNFKKEEAGAYIGNKFNQYGRGDANNEDEDDEAGLLGRPKHHEGPVTNSDRRSFIVRVYAIIGIQLLINMSWCLIVVNTGLKL